MVQTPAVARCFVSGMAVTNHIEAACADAGLPTVVAEVLTGRLVADRYARAAGQVTAPCLR